MFDQPITLRTLLYVALFIVFFPFSLVFVFPRTALAAAFVLMGLFMLDPVAPSDRERREAVTLTDREIARGDWTELQARCAGLKGKEEEACFDRGLDAHIVKVRK